MKLLLLLLAPILMSLFAFNYFKDRKVKIFILALVIIELLKAGVILYDTRKMETTYEILIEQCREINEEVDRE